MRYFSGFSLEGEEALFEAYLDESVYCVGGFSYGAQQAFDYVYSCQERIDKLLLFSPAFFQTKKPSFTRTQLRYFNQNNQDYMAQFLKNTAYPANPDALEGYLQIGKSEELGALLDYTWNTKMIDEIIERGTSVEVFLGREDKIIDSDKALVFFGSSKAMIYSIKGAGHLLKSIAKEER